MFGNQDDQQDTNQIPDQAIDAAMSVDPQQPAPLSAQVASALPLDQNAAWQHPGNPMGDGLLPAPVVAAPAPLPQPVVSPTSGGLANDLIDIKQQALTQLSPLIGHLDQTPEEKFRTTMMMIQASDDQTMIKPAYDAAQLITDEKVRAQALLDIINEINYFTQHQEA
jgi:hypothetical protein